MRFPTQKEPKIVYGGDYNPEQWEESTWEEDMRLLKLAGVPFSISFPNQERFVVGSSCLLEYTSNGSSICLNDVPQYSQKLAVSFDTCLPQVLQTINLPSLSDHNIIFLSSV